MPTSINLLIKDVNDTGAGKIPARSNTRFTAAPGKNYLGGNKKVQVSLSGDSSNRIG